MKKRPHVFDSHALLKLFQREKGYEQVVHLLREIEKSGSEKCINAVNLGEIVYITKRAFGDQKKIEVLAGLERLRFRVLPVPLELVFQAAELKAQYAISYADSFALASTIEEKARLVTGDPEFKKVAQLVDIVWV